MTRGLTGIRTAAKRWQDVHEAIINLHDITKGLRVEIWFNARTGKTKAHVMPMCDSLKDSWLMEGYYLLIQADVSICETESGLERTPEDFVGKIDMIKKHLHQLLPKIADKR